eukprot:TRINITY_DN1779_c1_g1_i1.p1 TRINITY_DN1779_c1_g1~~TRINITY_DN1779_c1_g1_i1.p1  ORF type:complete len:547 (+),score=126.46 TRINITY_DN1779_c1_g1_i1:85-1725(+)
MRHLRSYSFFPPAFLVFFLVIFFSLSPPHRCSFPIISTLFPLSCASSSLAVPHSEHIAHRLLLHSHAIGRSCSRRYERVQCDEVYVCDSGECSHCDETTQCQRLSSQSVCSKRSGKCHHKKLLSDFSWNDVGMFSAVFIGATLSAAGGLGGGGLFVPLIMIIGGFTTAEAIPLSKATAFGTAIANFIVFGQQKNRIRGSQPLIDYGSAAVLEPAVLLGAVVGVYLNIISPPWLIILLLGIVLVYASIASFSKGRKTWRDETEASSMGQTILHVTAVAVGPGEEVSDLSPLVTSVSAGRLDITQERERSRCDQRIKRTFPWDFIGFLCIAWVVVFVIALLRGSCSNPSMIGVSVCTTPYWILVFLAAPCLISIIAAAGFILRRDYDRRLNCGHLFINGEILWSSRNTSTYPVLCMLAGVTTSLLGIGGGMLLSPIFLTLGMLADVSAATTSYTVLFTESSIGLQFILLGRMQMDYACALLVLGIISAFLGRLVIGYYVKKHDRSSILIFIVAFVIALSAVVLTVIGIIQVIDQIQAGGSMGFRSVCC